MKGKIVKVMTEGHDMSKSDITDSPDYQIRAFTDDGRTYILNYRQWVNNIGKQ